MSNKQSKTVLSALTAAALCIPGMAYANGDTPDLDPILDDTSPSNFGEIRSHVKYTHYQESNGRSDAAGTKERYNIDVWQGLFVVPYKNYEFSLSLKHDVQSGASVAGNSLGFLFASALPVAEGRSGATIYDNRNEVSIGVARNNPGSIETARLDYSIESDYQAVGGALGKSWSFNKNNTVLRAQAGLSYDRSRPKDSAILTRVGGDKLAQKYYVSLKQDLTKYNFVQLSLDFSYDTGFLDDSYRFVTINGDSTAAGTGQSAAKPSLFLPFGTPDGVTLAREKRPRSRAIFTPMLRFVTKLPYLNSSMHFDYRYANSSFGNKSHMFEMAYFQTFAKKLRFTPRFRYYTQSAADFYAPFFDATGNSPFPATRLTGDKFSSDGRLSSFGSISVEGKLSYDVMDNVTLSATGAYYKWSQKLKWGSKDPFPSPGFNASAKYGSVELRVKM